MFTTHSSRFVIALALASTSFIVTPTFAQPPAERLLLDAGAAPEIPGHAVRNRAQAGRVNPSVFRAGRILVELPDGRQLEAERAREERGARGELTWVGEFENAPGSLLVLTAYRGVVTGFLHHGAETYELGVARDGRTLLFQVNDAALPDEGAPVAVADTSADAAIEADLAAASPAADVVVQDLLVVYTPASANRAGSAATLESKIVNAVAAANAAYSSSAVNIRLNLVGMAQTAYTETGDMGVTLSRLRATSDGYMDEVHTWRNQTGADLVSLVSDDSNYCGIAYVMSSVSSGFASSAFSVVFQNCFSNQTLAHEIGHNQGNSHDRANGGNNAYPYAFGYRTCDNIAYTAGQSFRTVMSYACGSAPRLNYFSNPNVFYNGAPMGVDANVDAANAADNARAMNNTAAVTAGFRSAPATTAPNAPSNLSAVTQSASAIGLSWADGSSDESGFTIERAVGTGSFSVRATVSANTTSFVDSGLASGTVYHYRVRAYNSVGSSAWSGTASAETQAAVAVPNAPSPAAVSVSGSTAVVAWTNVSGETSYRVVRETYNSRKRSWSGTSYTVGADVTSFSQSLSSGTYRYTVSAVNASGASAPVIAEASGSTDGSFVIGSTTSSGGGKPSKDGSGGGKPSKDSTGGGKGK